MWYARDKPFLLERWIGDVVRCGIVLAFLEQVHGVTTAPAVSARQPSVAAHAPLVAFRREVTRPHLWIAGKVFKYAVCIDGASNVYVSQN
jgi:hypothetical protein